MITKNILSILFLCFLGFYTYGCAHQKPTVILDMSKVYERAKNAQENEYDIFPFSVGQLNQDYFEPYDEILKQIREQVNIKEINADNKTRNILPEHANIINQKIINSANEYIKLMLGKDYYIDSKGNKVKISPIQKAMDNLNHISTAISIYYSVNDTMPGVNKKGSPSSQDIAKALKDNAFITSNKYYEIEDGYWNFIGCRPSKDKTAWEIMEISSQNNLCVYASSIFPEKNNSKAATLQETLTLTAENLCLIEKELDDGSLKGGNGRLASGANLKNNNLDLENLNCEDSANKKIKGIHYLFRVF